MAQYAELRAEAAHGVATPSEGGRVKADFEIGEPSVYASVMVGAFGGVSIKLSGGQSAKLHPALLLLLCVPVFIAQVSILLYLRLDLDFKKPLFDPTDTGRDELLRLKLLMVVITYLMNFQNLMKSMHHLVFITNPITWVEVKRATPQDWAGEEHRALHWLFRAPTLAPWAFLAVGMNILVNYMVCTDSVSVILSSPDAQNAIFNSLAITFIVDLGAHWWKFLEYIFHIQSFEDFEFFVDPKGVWEMGSDNLTQQNRDIMELPWITALIVKATTWRCLGLHHTFLRNGYGARRLCQAVGVFALALIYTRQLFVVLQAVRTGILPVARDICTEYYLHRRSRGWQIFEHFLFVRIDLELNSTFEHDHELTARCETSYTRLTLPTALNLLHQNTAFVSGFAAMILTVMLAPTIGHAIHSYIVDPSKAPAPSAQEAKAGDSQHEVPEVHVQLRDLKHEVEQLRPLKSQVERLLKDMEHLQQQQQRPQ